MIAPRISAVTPSYNQGEYLEACIDSILSQNYPNLEYIIMDGGSTDNSVEIIKKYEKYLTYWQSTPDGGQYNAINEGFKKTSGEIMAWLNSDDKYHHHAFFKAAYIFTKHKDIEWITGRTTQWDKNGDLSFVLDYLPRFSREKYLQKEHMDPCIQQESTFWRRSLWEKTGGFIRTDLTYAGDLELWMRFFRHAPLYVADTLLGGYRMHGNQKAQLFQREYIEEADRVLDEEIAKLRRGEHAHVLPAPEPIHLDYREVKSYIDNVCVSTQHEVYKLSDDADIVSDFLLKKLIELKRSESEAVIKEALVIIFRKLRIYDFYIRHEPSFSRVYHFFREFIVSDKSKGSK